MLTTLFIIIMIHTDTRCSQRSQTVKKTIPPEQLLIFNVGVDGFEELSTFLNTPPPRSLTHA